MANSTPKAGISSVVNSLVNSVVKCGIEPGKVGGKVPVLVAGGSLRRIFFRSDLVDLTRSTDWKYFSPSAVKHET